MDVNPYELVFVRIREKIRKALTDDEHKLHITVLKQILRDSKELAVLLKAALYRYEITPEDFMANHEQLMPIDEWHKRAKDSVARIMPQFEGERGVDNEHP